jgi:beta-galactosidase
LHILPHWNWEGREGEVTPVYVYTSYDSAELFLNGKSLGIQEKNSTTPQNRYRLMWTDVTYEPGTLKVVAYDKNGNAASEKEIHTAGKPYRLILESDLTTIKANGEDLAFVTVSVVDKNGRPCPTASNQLKFDVQGKGTFRAACNGDATSLELFHLPTMKLFSGKLVVIVQSTSETGEIKLSVTGKGLKTGKTTLHALIEK